VQENFPLYIADYFYPPVKFQRLPFDATTKSNEINYMVREQQTVKLGRTFSVWRSDYAVYFIRLLHGIFIVMESSLDKEKKTSDSFSERCEQVN